jgi:hypothetical protein
MSMLRIALLLMISLGFFWLSEEFPFYLYFEPQSPGWVLWVSYAKDLIQPFAFYFFICLGEKWLKTWHIRAILAFAVPALMEIGQIFYTILVYKDHLLYMGSFDPLDFAAYAFGVGIAVLVEQKIFAQFRLQKWTFDDRKTHPGS